MLTKKTNYKS